ncbi:PC4 domain-containing protein/DEK_C domain-containing protein [Cephalotus follicularis]|uniref:PC4 domain-containing protein/DEK_C domain-containing protein n=1 Tax=Cephalotus follicularis TaxID=3775 RepID=A0A1Q3D8K1_CEPFO|nr:PC4 domain-containing protein/DEK_C domain-containing protein [Cephalotus follicularis]
MEAIQKEKIEKTVREILDEADMNETTEYQVRKAASDKLNINLSEPKHKAFVRQVVDSFLQEQKTKLEQQQQQQQEEDENDDKEAEAEAEEAEETDNSKEFDDEGNLIICRLSSRRKVTVQDFRGRNLVSVREYYCKGDKELPTSKGISLTEEQWSALKKNIPAIEKAVWKMESKFMRQH